MIGQSIGNYRITAKIGAGGMGEVYRARDTKLDRDVAIKALPDLFAAQADRLSRFEREAKLLAGLNHPHIGGIYGLEEAQGKQYLVLELVDGEELAERIARGPVPVDEAIAIALQIAEALEAAHEQGIIHRDLKPANIKLTPAGQVKVLDFGLAKALDAGAGSAPDLTHSPTLLASSSTVAGVILGTAAYMSPEQARGRPVDKRADIFAFGAVVLEMLSGKQVFRGETVTDTLASVLRGEPDFATLPPGTPPALRGLVERCLDKDVRRRLRDIGEARIVLEDLRAGIGLTPVTAAAPAPIAPRGPGRRYALLLASVAVIAAAGVIWKLGSGRGSAELPLLKSVLVMSPDDTGIQGNFGPVLSPDGEYLVYISKNQLWLRDRAALEPLALAGTEGAQRPFWSPDGAWIGFGRNQELFKIPRVGGRPTLMAKLPHLVTLGNSSNACWTEDDRIVIGTGTTGLFQAPVKGGEATLLLPTVEGESDFHEVCVLPGGRGYVFVVHSHKGIGQLDVATPSGERHTLLQIDESVADPVYSASGHIVFRRTGASGGIWALPFALERLEVTGEPFLVASGGVLPSAAADGSLSFVTGVQSQQAQIVWLGRDGHVQGTIGRPEAITRPFPSLSPDGKSVLLVGVFGDGREIFLYDVASGNRRRLTFNDLREEVGLFHPNGVDVLFYEVGTYRTHLLSLDGSSTSRVAAEGIMPNISSDGTQILFARQKPDSWDWDIYVKPFQEGEVEPTELVATPAVDWWPVLSPDGRYMLYVSDETGRDEIYATNFPRPSTRWQVSVDGGQWPRWRADGREIFFTTHEALFAVDVDLASGLTLGTPRRLFRRPSTNWSPQWADGFDVTPDGQRFLVLQPVRDENAMDPTIVVVQNWFAEFEGSD